MVAASMCDLSGLCMDNSEILLNIKEIRGRLVRLISWFDLNSVIVKEVEDEVRVWESLL